jgi:class 3 adenylate cyclase/tetratricopeptide (TPR) repeat protein
MAVQTCPACGQENPDGFRLCGMCGAPLTSAATLPREERKVVSVLFTDLVGSTAMAERLDPEDVRAVLAPYYARLRTEIERHGGTVEKFIGDAVMAVFGAPVAHEDDAERAVRAALAIREAVSRELDIRTAVNTGEALVALGARPSEGEGIVSGDVVNTAARLQSAAPVNGILVGEATYRATRDAIDYRGAPAVEAKGKAEPISSWEVVGARASFGSDIEQRLRTPLVGRERERGLLVDALARARSEESVQLVTLVGVPGIGKSRLVAELFQIVEADEELIAWRQGRSLPYGERVSLWALGEIVKSHAGILESDSAEAAGEKLAALVEQLGADDREREWLERHTRPLVGLEGAERTERAEAFAAWRRLLEAAAEQRPLVLVFEDLHWADDGLLDFVDHLADWATTVPLLIVGTARPELLDRRPGWGGGKRNAFMLPIGALSDEDTARLLQRLLDRAVLDADAQQAVLRRAEGNPLYAEEYARMLAEQAGADLPLPETVQGLIAARIDGLTPDEKALLQDAAVIGKVFWPGAVDGADERLLHSLERKEFIRRDRRSSVAGEMQYAFLHALVRDVAYGQIPRARRAERHVAAAAWIESLSPDRSEDRAAMLAHHYREALALTAAAGGDDASLREPARRAFAEAAERAFALNAYQATIELANEGLALTPEGAPERAALQLLVAYAMWPVSHDDPALVAAAREGFLARGDIARAAEASGHLARVLFHRGDTEGARREGARTVELARSGPPSLASGLALARQARVLEIMDRDSETGLELAREALALGERFGSAALAANALNTIALARIHLGDPGGVEDLERAVAIAEEAGEVGEAGSALNNLVGCLSTVGRVRDADAVLARSRDHYTRYGVQAALIWNDGGQAELGELVGDLDRALEWAGRFFSHPDAESRYMARAVWTIRAHACLVRGQLDRAVADAERALAVARQMGHDAQMTGPVLITASQCLRAAGRTDEAEALLAEALTLIDEIDDDAVLDLPLHLVELGRAEQYLELTENRPGFLWQEAGRAAAAGDLIGASRLYERIGARFSEAWAALLAAEAGDASRLDAALAYFEEQRATPFAERCRARMSASA